MKLLIAVKEYMKEPIKRLLGLLVLLIILKNGFNIIMDQFVIINYEQPFTVQLANLSSKKELADIITGKMQSIYSIHKSIWLTSNLKQIELLAKDMDILFEEAHSALDVLKNGGSVIEVFPVNFYDKDIVTEEIFYAKIDNQPIPVDVINLAPKFLGIKRLLDESIKMKLEMKDTEYSDFFDDFNSVIIIKQVDSLMLRTLESVNKVTYEISIANKAAEESINQIKNTVDTVVLLIQVFSSMVLIFFTIIISYKISVILKSEKYLEIQNVELEQEQEELKSLLNKISVGIMIVGKDKKIHWANDNSMTMVGGDSIESLRDTYCYNVMHCTDVEKVSCPYWDVGLNIVNEETTLKHRNGEDLHILKSVQHIIWNNEEALLESFIDISNRKIAEIALENANKELTLNIAKIKNIQKQLVHSEKMASIGQLAAGVAHEINNPTGFITNNLVTMAEYIQVFKKVFTQLEILKESIVEKNTDLVNSTLETIKEIESAEDLSFIIDDSFLLISESSDGARRIKDIVNGLRDFARKDSVSLKEGNLNKIIEAALRLTSNELKYNCKIFKELGAISNILCHEDQLTQVFINLFVNSSHAFTDQGEITIKTWEEDKYIIAKVCDTGHGIPEENLTKLFDPFFTTKEVGKGTGLGLSISHGIIEDHGGTIEVESTLGKGTCFTIRIPAKLVV
jgi:signal transduction histidine kinase